MNDSIMKIISLIITALGVTGGLIFFVFIVYSFIEDAFGEHKSIQDRLKAIEDKLK